MVYLLYGIQEFLKEKKIKEIINLTNVDSNSINYYDLENDLLVDIIDDALMPSLFCDKKIIIVDNAYCFTGSTKKIIEQNLNVLETYLKNNNENTIIIFKVLYDKLDERKKIISLIKERGKVIEFNSTNINTYVKELFDNYIINYQDIDFLINRVGKNLKLLESEINKIKIYKDNDLNIKKEDIIKLTSKNIDNDIFALIDYIVNKNKEKALELYHSMLIFNEEPLKIIITLANQFRIIYQSKELYIKGYTENDITNILGIHSYRIKLALQKGRSFDSKTLLKYINELANMDISIKSGTVDKNIALELFILEL